MPKLVITVKLGVNEAGMNVASVVIRNVEKGTVASASFAGSKEELEELLKSFESNPEIRIKYE